MNVVAKQLDFLTSLKSPDERVNIPNQSYYHLQFHKVITKSNDCFNNHHESPSCQVK